MKKQNEKKQKEEVQELKEDVVVVEQKLQVSNEEVSSVDSEITKEEIVEKEEIEKVEQVKTEVPKELELDIKIKDVIKGKEIYSTNDYKLSDEELLYAVEKGFLLQINRYKYKVL